MFLYLSLPGDAEQHSLSVEDCLNSSIITIQGREGVISGFSRKKFIFQLECQLSLIVPEDRFLVMTLSILHARKSCDFTLEVVIMPIDFMMNHQRTMSPVLFLRTNAVNITISERFSERTGDLITLPSYKIVYESTTKMEWSRMIPVWTSLKSGFITSPGFDLNRPHSLFLDASYTLNIPEGLDAMVSFPYFKIVTWVDFFQAQRICQDGRRVHYAYKDFPNVSPEGCLPNAFVIKFKPMQKVSTYYYRHLYEGTTKREHGAGFNMSFSFHDFDIAPHKVSNGLFNCTANDYNSFQTHLHCNLHQECDAGEDEGEHCPFSSSLCQGMADAGGKCFFPAHSASPVTWSDARAECQTRGGDLAMMKSSEEWTAFWNVYDRIPDCVYIGLFKNFNISLYIYSRAWFWVDGTVAFGVNVTREIDDLWYAIFLAVMVAGRIFHVIPLERATCFHFICQTTAKISEADTTPQQFFELNTTISANMAQNLKLISCPGDEFVRLVAFCPIKLENNSYQDASAKKGISLISTSTHTSLPGISLVDFMCGDGETVSYSLVCDFIQDCPDGSDEDFCNVRQCLLGQFQCENGQCINERASNDHTKDCIDGSDAPFFLRVSYLVGFDSDWLCQMTQISSVLDFREDGMYVHTSIHFDQPCPATHFRCSRSTHCLPVYLLCNGVKDCLNHEDEHFCDIFSCPGFFRCRRTNTCVHISHLCDGIAQCPWRDDEMWCDVEECPQHCQCQGLSFVCRQPFPAVNFPQLRYLDGSQSMMTVDDFASNAFLVYLKLSSCGIKRISTVTLPNLQHLDISWNEIRSLHMDVFLSLGQLSTLSLKGNPLNDLSGGMKSVQRKLTSIEISHTPLNMLSGDVFKSFISLKTLNLSFNRLSTIKEGFQSLSALQQVDLRGNIINDYPQNTFKNMRSIRSIYANDYKLCCPGMLPDRIDISCQAPSDELSSCEDLLFLDVFRAFLWFVGVASVLGNTGCFCFRNFILKNQSVSGFNIFVSNLSVADCLMGIYLIIIGVADNAYRGKYYLYEDIWLFSIPCRVSGVLSLLSSEVSAFTIWFITLDRFLVLRFPFSTRRFTRKSAVFASVLMWAVGLSLALTPLFIPLWQFYSQTGICIPLPITKKEFGGYDYSFGVMIVLNFILLLLIAGGQGFIYHSVHSNSLTTGKSRTQKDVTIARRLITVAMSDFLCWFPIGLLGLLSAVGVSVQAEVNVSMSVFVLPLNSALNPFLYTFNIITERRNKRTEARIMKYLETTAILSSSCSATSCLQQSSYESEMKQYTKETKEGILQMLHRALNTEVIVVENVRAIVSSLQNKID